MLESYIVFSITLKLTCVDALVLFFGAQLLESDSFSRYQQSPLYEHVSIPSSLSLPLAKDGHSLRLVSCLCV